jgi:hypothetical protein
MDGSSLLGRFASDAGIATAARPRRWSLHRLLSGLALLLALVGIGLDGRYYCTTGRFRVSTSDEQVHRLLIRANSTNAIGLNRVP